MVGRPKVVLAVSQSVGGVPSKCEPDKDFLQMARKMDAVLIGTDGLPAGPLITRLSKATALDFNLAARTLHDHPDADVYVSFSERVGIPLGIALAQRRRRPSHILIAHKLDTIPKRLMNVVGRWTAGVDKIIVLCNSQREIAERVFRVPCRFIKGCVVDESFFCPDASVAEEDYVLSVGSESRDYETLMRAAQRLPFRFKILSSSPWCRRKNQTRASVCSNIEFLSRVSYVEMRDLYRRARLVVVPLKNVTYAAGLNGVEEAITVNKPVIVSASRGIIDYVDHLRNAYLVPCGDADAMANAVQEVHRDESLRRRLRSGTECDVSDWASLGRYVSALENEVRDVC